MKTNPEKSATPGQEAALPKTENRTESRLAQSGRNRYKRVEFKDPVYRGVSGRFSRPTREIIRLELNLPNRAKEAKNPIYLNLNPMELRSAASLFLKVASDLEESSNRKKEQCK
jgi:hypothetical protein